MSFLDKVPENIALLEKENSQFIREKIDAYGHECDCEFCDRQDEGRDEDKLTELEKQMKSNTTMIKRLKSYQKLWGVES